MYLRKTFDKNNYLRLENVEGDNVTVFIKDSTAIILSVLVSSSMRGLARGTELILAMEQCLFERGIKHICAVYSAELLNVCDLLSICDYIIVPDHSLVVHDALEALSQVNVNKAISAGKNDKLFIPLSDLNADSTNTFMYDLNSRFNPLSMTYVAGFSQDLSGVVFGSRGSIGAMILCSKYGSGIHIDYFYCDPDAMPQYAKPLINGFLYRAANLYNEKAYDYITYMPTDNSIDKLVNAYLGENSGSKTEISFLAEKHIKKAQSTCEIRDVGTLPEDLFMRTWEREVASVPYQNNILIKDMN